MPGVIIYRTKFNRYYSLVSFDDNSYNDEKIEIPKRGDTILWDKGNVTLEQLENSRKTKDSLVRRLNDGENIKLKDLKNELKGFFKYD
jgi:hypothetical protein